MFTLWMMSALAGPPDLVESLGAGVQVNWTVMELQIEASTRSLATGSVEAVEQLARREVEAAVQQTVGDIPVTGSLDLGEVLEDAAIGVAVQARTSRWRVRETTYGQSGRVRLVAALSLQDLLKPWVLTRTVAAPPSGSDDLQRRAYTGLLLDARGSSARPAYAPRIIDPAAGVLFQAELEEAIAVREPPFRFVTDPGHPASMVAGARPLVIRVDHARGPDLYLSEADAKSVQAHSELLRQGRVVVILDAS
ncbi:MAG: hypothetical protein KTR31_26215 [Myxococcales bacterium]|nr:hypothetical protein [Myxococcales bacterium]